MVQDNIQLGAKKPQSKSLSCAKLRGFFNGGGSGTHSRCESTNASRNPVKQRTPVRQHLIFYDIPSSKRVARCTNILHTGATLSGVGEGQRLRKGFQGQSRNGRKCLVVDEQTGTCRCTVGNPTCFESLSSAAEIRHSARNTRL